MVKTSLISQLKNCLLAFFAIGCCLAFGRTAVGQGGRCPEEEGTNRSSESYFYGELRGSRFGIWSDCRNTVPSEKSPQVMLESSLSRLLYWAEELGLIVNHPRLTSVTGHPEVGLQFIREHRRHLALVDVQFSNCNDQEFLQIANGVDLQSVNLGLSAVSIGVMAELAQMERLQAIAVHDTEFNSPTLAKFSDHAVLEWISVGGSKVDGLGLAKFLSASKCTVVLGHGLQWTSNGTILNSNAVEFLDLSFADLRSVRLGELPRLRILFISSAQINDEFVDGMVELPRLERVYAIRTEISETQKERIQLASIDIIDSRRSLDVCDLARVQFPYIPKTSVHLRNEGSSKQETE